MPILPAVFVKSLHSHLFLKNQLPPVTFWRYQFGQIHFNIIKVYTHTTQRDLQQWVGKPHTSAPSCSICPLPELCLALPSQTTTQDTALDHCGVGTLLAFKSVIFLLTQWVPVGRKQGTETCSYIKKKFVVIKEVPKNSSYKRILVIAILTYESDCRSILFPVIWVFTYLWNI